LVLQNPGTVAASVRIQWISPDGPVREGPSRAQVGPNRTVAIEMPQSDVPLFALVTVVKGSVVPGGTSSSLAGLAFAATTGVPLP
jgi:hypothetical protein